MSNSINEVLIVGGGTAGWLSAGILAKQLNSRSPQAVQVTLVESPNIPIMGVGEGTWPSLRSTLRRLDIDEGKFMRECDATFKQGTEFVNWMERSGKTEHRYFHPLSAVFHAAYDFNLAPYWLLNKERLEGYDVAVSSQANICKAGLAPKKITTPAYQAVQNYSYHLNANKFASFLTKHCVENLGVKHIVANVLETSLDESGFVKSVKTDSPDFTCLKADFFVDCSGSSSILLGKALNVPWIGINDTIFNDTAVAIQVPYSEQKTPIATHTIATAFEHGWTWDIGLHNRRGTGYVYSSDYVNDEQAELTLRKYLGADSEGLNARKIKLNLGYRKEFWKNNCVAIGMSAAFIEPLEASAIFLIDAAANMLAEQFPRTLDTMKLVAKQYNQTFSLRWQKTLDFVKLHYCISNRSDSDYWLDNRRKETIPDSLNERLELWKSQVPSKYDFDYAYEPFVLDSYLYVLYGMNYPTNLMDNKARFSQQVEADKHFLEVQELSSYLKGELPAQRALVESVYKYGFQKI